MEKALEIFPLQCPLCFLAAVSQTQCQLLIPLYIFSDLGHSDTLGLPLKQLPGLLHFSNWCLFLVFTVAPMSIFLNNGVALDTLPPPKCECCEQNLE